MGYRGFPMGGGIKETSLPLHHLEIVRDLDRVPQGDIHRAIFLFAQLDCLAYFFRIESPADGLIMDVDFSEPPGRIFILHRLCVDFELSQFYQNTSKTLVFTPESILGIGR